jgi:hypothetical protein
MLFKRLYGLRFFTSVAGPVHNPTFLPTFAFADCSIIFISRPCPVTGNISSLPDPVLDQLIQSLEPADVLQLQATSKLFQQKVTNFARRALPLSIASPEERPLFQRFIESFPFFSPSSLIFHSFLVSSPLQ